MKVYKLEVMIIDFDELGGEEIKDVMENQKYPNYCISPDVMSMQSVDIGEWSDEHPLNKLDTQVSEYNRLFPQP